jgi:protein KRI1
VEILMATDQELNEYMSVKRYAPYRNEAKWDSKRNDRLKELKASLAERISTSGVGQGNDAVDKSTKKRKGKKERLKMKAATVDEVHDEETKASPPSPVQSGGSDTSKRKREAVDADDRVGSEQDHRKKKRRRKKKELQAGES